MKPTHIEHIGIAVRSLHASIPLYEKMLGVQCSGIEEVHEQKVRTAFFSVGESKVELLESMDPAGAIGRFIETRGEGIHHLAFAVGDLARALDEMKALGLRLVDEVPRLGAEGCRVAFLHPRSTNGVLVELCELPARKTRVE